MKSRAGRVARKTRETDVALSVRLAPGPASVATGVPFFDHMLEQLSKHGGMALEVKAKGDLEVDAHHTVEDVGRFFGATVT